MRPRLGLQSHGISSLPYNLYGRNVRVAMAFPLGPLSCGAILSGHITVDQC